MATECPNGLWLMWRNQIIPFPHVPFFRYPCFQNIKIWCTDDLVRRAKGLWLAAQVGCVFSVGFALPILIDNVFKLKFNNKVLGSLIPAVSPTG